MEIGIVAGFDFSAFNGVASSLPIANVFVKRLLKVIGCGHLFPFNLDMEARPAIRKTTRRRKSSILFTEIGPVIPKAHDFVSPNFPPHGPVRDFTS